MNTALKLAGSLTLLISVSACRTHAADVVSIAEEIYQVNTAANYEVSSPKPGYLGGARFGTPPQWKTPQSNDDYEKRFIRVRILGNRATAIGIRVVLKLDEVNEEGKLIKDGVYYAYVDISGNSFRMISKAADDNDPRPHDGRRSGIPFPLFCAMPPMLAFSDGVRDSVAAYSVDPVNGYYQLKEAPSASADDGRTCRIATTAYQEYSATKHQQMPQRFFDPATRLIENKEGKGRIPLVEYFRETQVWRSSHRWLWDTMERRDIDNNVTLRCKRMTFPEAPKPKE